MAKDYNNKYDRRKQNNDAVQQKPKIEQPLHEYYSNYAKIYLEDGEAYQIAQKLGDIPPHQMRKILNPIKEAMVKIKNGADITTARNVLFNIVPLTAYNAARDKNNKDLYEFVRSHINEQSIQSSEDIEILDKLFTSIIAYHRYFQEMKKRKGGR